MVKILLPLCNMEHLDNNSNSIYHYASITSKEMINVSYCMSKGEVVYAFD